jgi:hypothetical protein
MIKFFLALTMLSTSAMAADLDYYDEVPLAPTGPPTVVMVRPIPMAPAPVPVPMPVPVPAPAFIILQPWHCKWRISA